MLATKWQPPVVVDTQFGPDATEMKPEEALRRHGTRANVIWQWLIANGKQLE
jgi:hypothetical protein